LCFSLLEIVRHKWLLWPHLYSRLNHISLEMHLLLPNRHSFINIIIYKHIINLQAMKTWLDAKSVMLDGKRRTQNKGLVREQWPAKSCTCISKSLVFSFKNVIWLVNIFLDSRMSNHSLALYWTLHMIEVSHLPYDS